MSEIHHPIVELTIVRTKEFLRETEALFWVFGFPLILAVALGFAFRSKPPDRVPVGVVAGPNAAAREAALAKSPALLPRIMSAQQAAEALRSGKVSLVVEGEGEAVYRYDPTRPEARTARVEADDALQSAAGRRNVVKSSDAYVREQGSRYIDFLIPGLIGMNLMGTSMWGVGFTLVNARVRKILKRLVATPMRKSEYLLSQFFARLVFLCLEVGVLVAFGWIVFGVRVHGSLVLLVLLCVVGAFAFSGIGMLTASRAQSIEAISGIMNVVMMPMWICSGVFFSYERFPDAVKPLIRALPLTALTDSLRAVMNDAAPVAAIALPMLILIAWGAAAFAFAMRIFRWQ